MEVSINCPGCGKTLKVNVTEEPVKKVTVIRPYTSLYSWTEIKNEIKSGNADGFFKIGDVIPIELKNGESVKLVVAAINHYEVNQVVFIFDNLVGKHNINEEDANTGGWRDCKMRDYLNYEFIELLPDELKAVISARTIVQRINGKNYLSTDKLWLPSTTEVGGKCAADIGDVAFPIFSGERSRVREFNGETYWWWLRSPNVSDTTYFWYVYGYGGVSSLYASDAGGVCPCFSI